jgi:hypothetical protein
VLKFTDSCQFYAKENSCSVFCPEELSVSPGREVLFRFVSVTFGVTVINLGPRPSEILHRVGK